MISESAQELAAPMQAREQSTRIGKAQDRAALGHDSLINTTHSNPSQSHFMLRQQRIAEISALAATD